MELIIFAEEEGTTFNLGMLGSRAWVGTLTAERLSELKNRDGLSYLQAGAAYGVDPYCLEEDRLGPRRYRGLIELHVEQGPAMWNAGVPVAVVTAINGRRQYAVTLTGKPNHAGSTQMHDRFDALTGAAECVLACEKLALELVQKTTHTVLTVGRLTNEPNGLNVIPGRTSFFIDFRARNDDVLAEGDLLLRTAIMEIAARRGLELDFAQTETLPAMPLDVEVCDRLRQAAGALGIALPDAASGALHDAAILAPYLPLAMLFIASEGGISHNPAEYSRIEDIAAATRILLQAVTT
ncbi:MAG: hydantoinase/carbamoylase family amidase [Pirellulales bacterium]